MFQQAPLKLCLQPFLILSKKIKIAADWKSTRLAIKSVSPTRQVLINRFAFFLPLLHTRHTTATSSSRWERVRVRATYRARSWKNAGSPEDSNKGNEVRTMGRHIGTTHYDGTHTHYSLINFVSKRTPLQERNRTEKVENVEGDTWRCGVSGVGFVGLHRVPLAAPTPITDCLRCVGVGTSSRCGHRRCRSLEDLRHTYLVVYRYGVCQTA